MGEFEIRLKNATASPAPIHTEMKTLASEYADFKNLVWQALTKISEQTNLLSLGLERHEAFLRRKVLLFHGVAETNKRLAEVIAKIQDDSGDMHGISQQAVSVIAKNVAEALAKRAHLFINMPTLLEDQQDVIRGFRNICGFPSVIGAIDCTHIKIKRVGGEMSEAYVNRKGYYSINTQVVCDADLKIRDIVARWRGSAHDSRIFNESSLKRRLESGEFHGRLLGDSGYACTDKLFTPVRNPADHREEAYNRAHIRTRNTVERCFGLFKQRFRCLLRGMYMKLSTAKTTIVALAVLHNIAIDMKEQIDIVTYVRQRTRRVRRDTVRGAIIRRNFINQHF
ncbi:DDE superfamily endonuclease domain-containing protein [Phthorimaea operculella]|nr:DDE superfamily endonuclease domain-containing protein [Phthorimaea operculella]